MSGTAYTALDLEIITFLIARRSPRVGHGGLQNKGATRPCGVQAREKRTIGIREAQGT